MSYILSALKKSQQERAGVVIPSATVAYLPHVPTQPDTFGHQSQAEIRPEARGRSRAPGRSLLLSGVLLATMALGTSALVWRMSGPAVESGGDASERRVATTGTQSVVTRTPVSAQSTEEILASSWPGEPLLAQKRDVGKTSEAVRSVPAVAGVELSVLPVPSKFHPPGSRIAQSPTSWRPRAQPVSLAAREPGPLPPARPVAVDEIPVVPPKVPPEERQLEATPSEGRTASVESAPAAPDIPRLDQLPVPLRRGLPPLALSVHAYDPQPGRRFVRINNAKHREGDRLDENLWLQEITQEGAVIRYRDLKFSISAF
jgi:hypothetical protein